MKGLLDLHRQANSVGPKSVTARLMTLLLLPPSWLYALVARLRASAYERHLFPVYQANLPVLSVGNLAAGGTGKTPTVDWLIKQLQQREKKPAVVSRGYGGTYRERVGVVADGQSHLMTAEQCGDEPLLLARRNPGVPVVVARRRADGIRYLERAGGVDVVILDDGFQHRAVARTLDLVLLDATNPFGNGWTLPAGMLREGKGALKRADILLLTRAQDAVTFACADKPVFFSRHQLADVACDLYGAATPLAALQHLKIAAFAGIADPESFFVALRRLGLQLETTIPLSDHVTYTPEVVQRLNVAAGGCQLLLTTEKDGSKLTPDMFSLPCYTVGMVLAIANAESLMTTITQKLWSTS